MSLPPRLLVVAHGTAVAAGTATTGALVAAIAAVRPDVPVSLCYLDVAAPSLPDALAAIAGPTVLVPLLLSTGYHVETDIAAAAAASPEVVVARHLGPDPLLTDALADRLPLPPERGAVALVGTGSSRPGAARERARAGALLAARIGLPVHTLGMGGDVRGALAALPQPLSVAAYLLAPGRFLDLLRGAADGIAPVGEPIGLHPALVDLVWHRYDEALRHRT
jgi:sirohydrochlorin ferrochelatase